MDDLTEKFHVSRTYISRLLKKYAGKSFLCIVLSTLLIRSFTAFMFAAIGSSFFPYFAGLVLIKFSVYDSSALFSFSSVSASSFPVAEISCITAAPSASVSSQVYSPSS